MAKQKVKDEIAARFKKKNWLVKALRVAYCVTGVLLMTAVPVYADDIFCNCEKCNADGLYRRCGNCNCGGGGLCSSMPFSNEF